MAESSSPKMHRNVYLASFVSLFNDASSEMVYPLLPLFLTGVLNAAKGTLGWIEGAVEATASLLKVASGVWSDRYKDRKGPMLLGYGLSVMARPLIASAGSWVQILGARLLDRVGKGVRTAPRDAVIADCTDLSARGRAYGFHRAMDTVGAAVGPAVAMVLLGPLGWDMRSVFWVSVIPGILALTFIYLIRDRPPVSPPLRPRAAMRAVWRSGGEFRAFVSVTALFTLANSSDAFLLLRAREEGLSVVAVTGVYLAYNLVYAGIAQPVGILADRVGGRRVIAISFFYYAGVYAGFAACGGPVPLVALFILYGGFQAVEEGVKKAYLSQLIPSETRASGMGLYDAVKGICLLPASVLTGWLWDRYGSGAALGLGATLALLAGLLFLACCPRRSLTLRQV